MIRNALLALLITGIALLAVRRWFAALCALILLSVLTQHPSMPTQMFGIQGLNPWNGLFLIIVVCWWINRRHEPPGPPASDAVAWLFAGYGVMVVVAGVVAAFDVSSYALTSNVEWVFIDGVINPLKYLAVGYLVYDGVRTRQRMQLALFAAVAGGAAYAALMYKSMSWRILIIDFEDARRMTDKLIGLFANDLGKVLAFTFWALLCLGMLLCGRWLRSACFATALGVLPAFVALKSRAGFLAFAMIGLTLGLLRWRALLPVLALTIGLMLAIPAVHDRVFTGVEDESVDWDAVSAGRVTNLWPPVLDQISMSPIIGHGRFGILREDCRMEIMAREGSVPTHPHNAYLEVLLDAGLVGLAIVLSLLAVLVYQAVWLMQNSTDRLGVAVGSVALTALVAELSAAVAGSSFFPTQSAVPCLCIWAIALRAYAEGAYARRFACNTAGATSRYGRAPGGVAAVRG